MPHPIDAVFGDPWRLLEVVLDGPLHPGGKAATADLLDRAAVDSGTSVLDIGCGAGGALRLASERGAQAVGLDHEPRGTDAVRGDMTEIPFQDASFDAVLGECVLCLSPDLERTLSDVKRILKPGGRLALSDVTVEGKPPEVPAPIDEVLCLEGPRERTYVRQQVARAGFEIEDVQSHRDDLLAMRDRVRDSLDYERLDAVLGDRGSRLRNGATELDAAIESGRIDYVSMVATRRF